SNNLFRVFLIRFQIVDKDFRNSFAITQIVGQLPRYVVEAIALIILATAGFFVPLEVAHPFAMFGFLVLTSITFSLLGFIIGIWADGFEKLQIVPLLVITPLTFLGGTFYSISMLPPIWQTVSLFNPVVYLISGFRWAFYNTGDVSIVASVSMSFLFLAICLGLIAWIFKTGYRLKA
ncbi:MAG: ABC transporter permease, partial [Rhodospirillales bacterium]